MYVDDSLYTVKVGLDCANAVRDLAQHMSSPGVDQWKAMEQVVGYLKDKELHGLIMKKPESLTVINYYDARYTMDKDLRKSVSSMINCRWSSSELIVTYAEDLYIE